VRRLLDSVYDSAAVLAAFCLCAMLVVIVTNFGALVGPERRAQDDRR